VICLSMKSLFHSLVTRSAGYRKNSLAVGFFLLTAHCSLLTLQAQSPEPAEVLRIDSDLVNLNISVFNRIASSSALALQQKDFTILDNGVAQEISFFTSSDAPFDLVLLLDLSGSTAEKIGLIRKSSKRFVDAVRPGDRVAIFTFSADILAISKFTSDRAALKKSIDEIEKPIGGTNFWDALRFVLDHVVNQSRVEQRRSAVIVMTDGVDNALPDVFGDGSRTTFEELLEAGRRSDAIILPIYLDTEKEANFRSTPPWAYKMAREQLGMLAAESGNNLYYARKVKDLDGVYEQVIRDLGTVYGIGYRPTNRGRDGAWHTVNVQVITHPDLAVRAKRGYYENKP
jgi:VWFA-related protein